ncbi:Ig-like domain-containing protein [Marinivivus vitaminiproducens]|uniref:Ig-like domain-containing protein n=1 Tax=Marinivivus vitaminiproducens TaxID=3035935 RepID=UPI00279F005C|nr:Ig-like domain-containing protein [Geminicoccaceae bacterium SCSIO 64248]
MASPIAQDDDITASRTAIRSFDLFADHGNGADSDPDGDRISVSRVENTISWVGKSFALESGARVQIQKDGTLIFNPNGAYDDLAPGESATETLAYTIRDPGGSVDHASVEVTIEGPEATVDASGLYFRAEDTYWRYQADGSAEQVVDAETGSPFIEFSGPVALDDAAFASARLEGTRDYALWRMGDDATAERIDDNGLTSAYSLRQQGDHLYFIGENEASGEEIWRVDAAGNAEIVADLTPGPEGSDPGSFTEFDGAYYFTANVDGEDELHRLGSNGTVENVDDMLPRSTSGLQIVYAPRADEAGPLYLEFSTSGTGGVDHYFSLDADGSLTRLSEVPSYINGNFVLGDSLYARFEQPSTGETRLYQINENAPAERIYGPNVRGSVLVTEDAAYFADGDATLGDDEPTTPYRLTAGNGYQSIGSQYENPNSFREVDGEVYFSASDPDGDGSAIYKVVETSSLLPTAEQWSSPSLDTAYAGPAPYDDMYYFVGADSANGREVWRAESDGTGAERVTDIDPGPADSYPTGLSGFEPNAGAATADDPLLA